MYINIYICAHARFFCTLEFKIYHPMHHRIFTFVIAKTIDRTVSTNPRGGQIIVDVVASVVGRFKLNVVPRYSERGPRGSVLGDVKLDRFFQAEIRRRG